MSSTRRGRGRRRPVAAQRGRPFIISTGLFGLLIAAFLAYVGFTAPNKIPLRSYYTISAAFSDADNLTGHYQVRVAGKLVGQVLNPRVVDGRAVVDLQLDKDLEPLLSDTTARVRPRSPIGVRFVELNPGHSGKPLPPGATIPITQTSASVPLDTALGTLDERTRARTQELLKGLGGGFADRGADLNKALGDSPAFLSDTGDVTSALANRTGATGAFISGGEAAAGAADPVRDVIATGFAPEAAALSPYADEREALAKALGVAPKDLSNARLGLTQSVPLLDETTGLAHDSLPALRAAPAALRETTALLREAPTSVRALSKTLSLAGRAVDPTLGLLRTVNPALPSLDRGFRSTSPLLTELGPRGCDITLMLRDWESMLAWGNQGGNYLRFNVIFGGESLGGQDATAGASQPIHQNPYPAPCATTNKTG